MVQFGQGVFSFPKTALMRNLGLCSLRALSTLLLFGGVSHSRHAAIIARDLAQEYSIPVVCRYFFSGYL